MRVVFLLIRHRPFGRAILAREALAEGKLMQSAAQADRSADGVLRVRRGGEGGGNKAMRDFSPRDYLNILIYASHFSN